MLRVQIVCNQKDWAYFTFYRKGSIQSLIVRSVRRIRSTYSLSFRHRYMLFPPAILTTGDASLFGELGSGIHKPLCLPCWLLWCLADRGCLVAIDKEQRSVFDIGVRSIRRFGRDHVARSHMTLSVAHVISRIYYRSHLSWNCPKMS